MFRDHLKTGIVLLSLARFATAQEPAADREGAPLAIRQQHIERLTDELESRLKQLTLALQTNEPGQAERLQGALSRSKELQIQARMAKVRAALERGDFEWAVNQQLALVDDLRSLLASLLAEDTAAPPATEESQRLDALSRAIERLLDRQRQIKAESDALGKAAPAAKESWEATARQQDGLTEKAQELAKGNSDAGAKGIDAAQAAMQQAAASLRGGAAPAASQQQQDAINDLLEALEEIKERQKELDSAREADKLAGLAEHFLAMLDRQQKISAETAALNVKRESAGGQLSRLDRNVVRKLGELERQLETVTIADEAAARGLAGMAQEAIELLGSASTEGALPHFVFQLRADLIGVGNLLADELETGEKTKALQSDIELALQALVTVLEEAGRQPQKSEPNQAASEAGGGKGKSKRLPVSMELQLLRVAQEQVHRRTTGLEAAHAANAMSGEQYLTNTKEIAARQAEITEMTARLLER